MDQEQFDRMESMITQLTKLVEDLDKGIHGLKDEIISFKQVLLPRNVKGNLPVNSEKSYSRLINSVKIDIDFLAKKQAIIDLNVHRIEKILESKI